MTILGIDWGEKKLGLALSFGKIAEPYEVVRYTDIKLLKDVLMEIIKKEKVEKIVIGISEGASEQKARKFGEQLSKELRINVVYFDETLSTLKAQELSKEAGITRKKARALEDAFAASIMLQSYLENTP